MRSKTTIILESSFFEHSSFVSSFDPEQYYNSATFYFQFSPLESRTEALDLILYTCIVSEFPWWKNSIVFQKKKVLKVH